MNALKPASAEELSDLLDKMTPEQIAALKEQILKKKKRAKLRRMKHNYEQYRTDGI